SRAHHAIRSELLVADLVHHPLELMPRRPASATDVLLFAGALEPRRAEAAIGVLQAIAVLFVLRRELLGPQPHAIDRFAAGFALANCQAQARQTMSTAARRAADRLLQFLFN